MNVAVIILNWNGKKLLEQFLPSVLSFSDGASIYVADNASTDDSISFLTKNYPTVQIIQNKQNGGYAKGYNDALKHVDADLFVLLNSDVEVTQFWLNPVVEQFSKEPNLVAAQPKILDYKRKSHFEYAGAAGGFIDSMGYPYCRGRIFDTLEEDKGQYNDIATIFWATGACLFVTKEAFMQARGFDEDFFAHQEEIDLCWRLQVNGGIIKYIGHSTVYHLGGATLETVNPKKTFYNFRNSLLILLKNIEGTKVYWIIYKRMILDGIAALKFLLQGKFNHFLAILKAHFSFYRMFPKFLKKRRKVASDFKYFKIKSIVWKYFIAKKRNFNNL